MVKDMEKEIIIIQKIKWVFKVNILMIKNGMEKGMIKKEI